MKNKSSSIPIAMLTKKFYCHKCGERLSRYPKTKMVKPGDSDYRKRSRLGYKIHMIGEVEVTEYDFKCPVCGNIIEYYEQCVVGKIQKQLRKSILSPMEIFSNRGKVEDTMDRNAKVLKVIFTVMALAVVVLILYFKIKSGELSFKIYL